MGERPDMEACFVSGVRGRGKVQQRGGGLDLAVREPVPAQEGRLRQIS